eukprot:TRINITY_DN30608_c0_g2_i1.p1 TRINITY_DN30608_c0_g2~~TRINITY_DN30608_c0_g2_i1.p1  ORF type:complete len:167 (+),score=47.29 TRINITY_DN30608_c0_g2_i1:130-630(+)
MGTPSGSKNCNVFSDRLDQRNKEAEFDHLTTDDAFIEKFGKTDKTYDSKLEKAQKRAEIQEFMSLKCDTEAGRKLSKLTAATAPGPAGPQKAVRRQLPGFVKLKSREGDDVDAAPAAKKAKVGEDAAPAPAPAAAAAPEPAPSPSPEQSPMGGLVAYGSESESEDA